ncbi:MAG: pantoate--beta-alanine ligase [Firmicutes bacterium]|nr:pantoate--beta-alanine ligase [Bacillota bacterium]
MTDIIDTIAAMRDWVQRARQSGESIALVPTMGALHRGHLALIRRAREEAQRVVVSIFVNPLQFGPQEDFDRYPRQLERDVEVLSQEQVDVAFAPSVDEMYPGGDSVTRVTVAPLAETLCGRARPGHFEGVATVVAKLFHIVQPDLAVFGEKDWQQLTIIRRMVADLNFPVAVVGVPTVREPSGLALSSRNQYLSAEERERASAIYRALVEARDRYREGERARDVLATLVRSRLVAAGLTPEYVEIVDPWTLREAPETLGTAALIAVAVRLGRARLIDNVFLGH